MSILGVAIEKGAKTGRVFDKGIFVPTPLMPRARNLKPGFFVNEQLVELPFEVRLLFAGLWTLADREGRLEDRPKKIKMAIFPADDVDVDDALCQLHESGLIERYIVDTQRFIAVVNFLKHQNPHVKEVPSTIPAPDQHSADTRPAVLIPSSLNPSFLNPESLNPTSDDVGLVFQAWKSELNHTKAKCDRKRTATIQARLREGFSAADLSLVPVGVKKSAFHMGDNPQKTRYDGIETVFKSAAQVEKFIDLARPNGNGHSHIGCDVCLNHPDRHVLTVKTGGYIFDAELNGVRRCTCNPVPKNGTA